MLSYDFPFTDASFEDELSENDFNDLYSLEDKQFYESIRRLYLTGDPTYQSIIDKLDPYVQECFHEYLSNKAKFIKYKNRTENIGGLYYANEPVIEPLYMPKPTGILHRFESHGAACKRDFAEYRLGSRYRDPHTLCKKPRIS